MDLEGFPGRLWLEGRTPLRLHAEAPLPGPMPRGPAERTGTGFLNAAMAPARTRSILLLEDALARGWLVDDTTKPIRILDGLASTGVRWRRWLHELPSNLLPRLRITANDLDGQALDWARATHAMHPPNTSSSFPQEEDRWGTMSHGEVVGGVRILREDLRQVLAREAFQWIDLDPFGSPMPFLDGAIQAIGRRGVLAVTATDTGLRSVAPHGMRGGGDTVHRAWWTSGDMTRRFASCSGPSPASPHSMTGSSNLCWPCSMGITCVSPFGSSGPSPPHPRCMLRSDGAVITDQDLRPSILGTVRQSISIVHP